MKNLIIVTLAIFAPLMATQRVMVMEDFTATWCTYCPGAARGAEELKFRAFDSVVVIAYHSSSSGDPFYTSTAATRASYYGISGYPTMRLDGMYSVVGGMHYGTMYFTYRQYFESRKTVPSPLDINLTVNYDSVSRNGTLTIVVHNTSGSTVSGQLHTALIESHIYYPWQGMDSLQDVERTMLPNASGEAITVAPGDSVVKTRDFTINTNWVAKNCELVVFVQDNSTREIYQGAMTAVMPKPSLKFLGYQPVLPAPGGQFELTVGLRNIGTAEAVGASATLSTSDPYITVVNNTTNFPAMPIGGDAYASSPFVIQVDGGCPDQHLAQLEMVITTTDATVDTVTFPLNITANPGFADNIEQGDNGWTHQGIRDMWHITNYRSFSPSNSWYCGVEGSYQYLNEMDARLLTPFFTLGDSAWVRFYHYYATGDRCIVEVNNGSPFWPHLAIWSGGSGDWLQEELDLSAFRRQTVQLCFRFISDYSGVAEGWYIDDFTAGGGLGVKERSQPPANGSRLTATVVRDILYLPTSGGGRQASGDLLDISGRKVMELQSGANDIRHLAPGVYFVRGPSDSEANPHPVVVVR